MIKSCRDCIYYKEGVDLAYCSHERGPKKLLKASLGYSGIDVDCPIKDHLDLHNFRCPICGKLAFCYYCKEHGIVDPRAYDYR